MLCIYCPTAPFPPRPSTPSSFLSPLLSHSSPLLSPSSTRFPLPPHSLFSLPYFSPTLPVLLSPLISPPFQFSLTFLRFLRKGPKLIISDQILFQNKFAQDSNSSSPANWNTKWEAPRMENKRYQLFYVYHFNAYM